MINGELIVDNFAGGDGASTGMKGIRRIRMANRRKGPVVSCHEAAGMEEQGKLHRGWIPCSEHLPEESLNSVIGWDEYRERCCFVQYYGGRWHFGNDDAPVKIIAWQPVPEPYKPAKECE